MLKLKNVSKYYYQDGVIATGITKINLELFLGEFVVITGESGSGKSTLLNVLSGLDTYEEGEMYINGEETSHYTEKEYLEYRQKYVSNIFQNFNLVNSYTVYQNIELAMLMNGSKKKDIKDKVNDLIKKVNLTKYKKTKVSKLSGGQKQRVAIARALAYDTPIIVCDEPTGSLDSKSSKSILELLANISKDKLVIVVTHNQNEIMEYATRLIRMHDGKILENRVIQKINLDASLQEKSVQKISMLAKLKLGIRNTFNLPVKFMLMFFIFCFIILTLVSNYGGIEDSENTESLYGINQYFYNTTDKRIILKKKDNSSFNEEDISKIENISLIDYIVQNDVLNDQYFYLNNKNIYLDGTLYLKKIDRVDIGNLPKNNNEIVLISNKDNYYINDIKDELLNKEFSLDSYDLNVKIVGILYLDDLDFYVTNFYFNDNLINQIMPYVNREYTNLDIKIDNKPIDYADILVSNKLLDGEIYISENYNAYCSNYDCHNKEIEINSHNIYKQNKVIFTNINTLNKKNYNNYLNGDYEDNNSYFIVNENDYNKIYSNQDNYQISVFIKEYKDLNEVAKTLNNMGYNTLKLKDTKVNDLNQIMQILKIFKLIITIILLVTVFFISYFVIKLIYKSRNNYYVTLRSLGCNKNDCIKILRNELLTFVNVAYLVFIFLVILINNNLLKFTYLETMIKYLTYKEYLLIYLILIILSILIANRYGKKVFKNSIMKNYGERV